MKKLLLTILVLASMSFAQWDSKPTQQTSTTTTQGDYSRTVYSNGSTTTTVTNGNYSNTTYTPPQQTQSSNNGGISNTNNQNSGISNIFK